MHAAVITDVTKAPGYAEFPEPEPLEGEVVADIRAAAVAQIVRLIAAGRHYSRATTPPMIAGLDGVAKLPDGSLVYVPIVRSPWGTLAERAAVSTATARPVPAGLDAAQAAAIVNAAFASWLPLTRILEPDASPTVLILGATGAAGSVAVPIAKHLGARRVIAVGREGASLRRTADRGADDVIPLDDDLREAITRIGADGVDVVLDFLWGDAGSTVVTALARSAPHPQHRIDWVNLRALDGALVPFDADLLRMSDLHVWGSGAGAYSPQRRSDMADAALELAARGVIEVDIQPYPLADIERTWNESGRLVYQP